MTNGIHSQTANRHKSSTLSFQVMPSDATTFADERSIAICRWLEREPICSELVVICSEVICSERDGILCESVSRSSESAVCSVTGEPIQSAMLLRAAMAIASSSTGFSRSTTSGTNDEDDDDVDWTWVAAAVSTHKHTPHQAAFTLILVRVAVYRLTLWCPLLPYGYSYKASCARLG